MIAVAVCAAIVLASGTTGDRVLGQLDFAHSAPNLVDAKGVSTPDDVAIDLSATPNRIYVADEQNNRVLGWRDAESFSNGAPADLVIGQPDFLSSDCVATSNHSLCTPAGVAVDDLGQSLRGGLPATAGCWSTPIHLRPAPVYSHAWEVRPIWSLARAGISRRVAATSTPR